VGQNFLAGDDIFNILGYIKQLRLLHGSDHLDELGYRKGIASSSRIIKLQ